MQLTNNFSLSELTKSQTAIRKEIANEPNSDQLDCLKLLCENVLQPVREHFGKVVTITSGFRSPQLCIALNSSIESQHCKGQAADFELFGIPNAEVSDWIFKNLEFDQLILEFWNSEEPNSGWVHCSFSPTEKRKQYLRAYKEDGRTKYKPVIGTILEQ